MKEVFAGNHPIPLNEDECARQPVAVLLGARHRRFAEVRVDHHARRQPRRGRHHGADRAGPARRAGQSPPPEDHHHHRRPRAAMFYGDGMVTPAISVLAVEGLEIVAPQLHLRHPGHAGRSCSSCSSCRSAARPLSVPSSGRSCCSGSVRWRRSASTTSLPIRTCCWR